MIDNMKLIEKTALEWLMQEWEAIERDVPKNILNQALEIEKQQIGYTKEDVLKAGEIGEINHHDTKHIVSLLDEAKEINNNNSTDYDIDLYSKVTRFEVIDHTKDMKGRCYVAHNCIVELSLQDNDRTLKVFVNDKI